MNEAEIADLKAGDELDEAVFAAIGVSAQEWVRNYGGDFYPSEDTDAACAAAVQAFGKESTFTLMRSFGAEGEFWVASAQGVPGIGTAETAALAMCRLISRAARVGGDRT